MHDSLYREWMRRLQLFLAAPAAKRAAQSAPAAQAPRTA